MFKREDHEPVTFAKTNADTGTHCSTCLTNWPCLPVEAYRAGRHDAAKAVTNYANRVSPLAGHGYPSPIRRRLLSAALNAGMDPCNAI